MSADQLPLFVFRLQLCGGPYLREESSLPYSRLKFSAAYQCNMLYFAHR